MPCASGSTPYSTPPWTNPDPAESDRRGVGSGFPFPSSPGTAVIDIRSHPNSDAEPLHDIALVDFPVARFLQMQEQHDAMLRELALVAMRGDEPGSDVPRRLLSLAREMQDRDSEGGEPFRAGVEAAAARGDVVVTLELTIPFSTLRWTEDFLMLFEEGDDYSRGGHLLTPPSPPEVVEFRRWFVGELIRQIRDGATPSPFWAETL